MHRRIGQAAPEAPAGATSARSIGRGALAAGLTMALLLAACGPAAGPSGPSAPSPRDSAAASLDADTSPAGSVAPSEGEVEPAPGSESAIYAPNPAAIVVAIDAGHGGCLDWGVPDPSQRGPDFAEKTMTLAMARALRDRLEADGISVVMIRDGDDALAGDLYPELGCEGPPWRDVNGDGDSGFDPEGATRTRDELQARLDLANLAAADVLVSIHVNSPFDGGQPIEIAFTETFYTDETPWGATATERLAAAVQDGIVAELGEAADYERGDRGITAHNFYLVAPTLFEPTPERDDPRRQPARNGLMPTILTEVGSITLRAEHDLLASAEGHGAVADGIHAGLAAYFSERPLAVRIGLAGEPVGAPPSPVPGDGPPFWAPVAPERLTLRIRNTGTEALPAGARIVAGWEASDGPYLARQPAELGPVGEPLPRLAPGESVTLEVHLPGPTGSGRALAWISLLSGDELLSDLGSPPLQLASQAP